MDDVHYALPEFQLRGHNHSQNLMLLSAKIA